MSAVNKWTKTKDKLPTKSGFYLVEYRQYAGSYQVKHYEPKYKDVFIERYYQWSEFALPTSQLTNNK